jgi:hypothetical protein
MDGTMWCYSSTPFMGSVLPGGPIIITWAWSWYLAIPRVVSLILFDLSQCQSIRSKRWKGNALYYSYRTIYVHLNERGIPTLRICNIVQVVPLSFVKSLSTRCINHQNRKILVASIVIISRCWPLKQQLQLAQVRSVPVKS